MEVELVKDAEDFERRKRRLPDEKLKEAMGISRAVEEKENLVAIRERGVGNLEELDAFKKSLTFGTDGAVDDESEVETLR